MKTIAKKAAFAAMVSTLAFLGLVGTAHSSGHFQWGLQKKYPAYDLNDTYVFRSSNRGYTSFISSANPSNPGTTASPSGTVFGEGGIYSIHIAKDGDFKTGMTLTFSFDGGDVEVGRINSPNADVGEKGVSIGGGKVASTFKVADGIRVWTGRGEEPFFGNGAGLGKFTAAVQRGNYTPNVFTEDGDLFQGSAASFIVVDVPNKLLGDQIKLFTTASVLDESEWVQVDRHATVLVPYIFLADTPAVKEDHQQHRPDEDVQERRQAIVNNVFWAVSVAKSKPESAMEYAFSVADMVMPDVLNYRPGTKASYKVGNLNGRSLGDDAMNTVLELMYGTPIDDNANDSHKYSKKFPYILSGK